MEAYAKRMADRITLPDPVIVGLSFGGMMAIEIAKIIPVKKIILISSAKGKKELPPYFTVCRYIPFHKLLPLHAKGSRTKILFYILGAKNEDQKKYLQDNIRINNRTGFNTWAIDKVVRWNNTEAVPNLVHIHGNKDKLLPHRYVKVDHMIANGGHLLIVNQAKEVSALLQKLVPLY